MTMSTNHSSAQVRAAERIESVIRAFAEETRGLHEPADGGSLLLSLSTAQATLSEVYAALAEWNRHVNAAEMAAANREGGDHGNQSWLRACLALEEASQYSRDAAAALDRARTADEVALWFDEIRSDNEV
jgi:hypothetical protein